jgi:hypothetical protein
LGSAAALVARAGGPDAKAGTARAGDVAARAAFLSVRNVVPTLTSNKRRGLSLNGRC